MTKYQDCAECCDQHLTKDMYPTMDGLICGDCVLDAFTEEDFPQCTWCGDDIKTGIDNQHTCKPEPTINDLVKQVKESANG